MATTQQDREAHERLLVERATAVHDARVAYDAAAPDRAPASPAQMIPAVRAAIIAMASTWSARAVELEGSTKRGSVGYQKELRSAATLARGFALWTEPEALYAAVMRAGGYAAPPEPAAEPTLDQQLDAAFGPLDQPAPIPSIEGGGATVTPLTILAPGQDPTPPRASLTGPPAAPPMALYAVAAPPERLEWWQIRVAAEALRTRDHVSPSTVMGLAECSLAWLIDHMGLNQHQTPAWWMVGGTAFHSAIEQLEQNLAAGHDQPSPDDIHKLWTTSLASAIDYQIDGPDTDPQLWRAANKGLENGAWWSVEGEAMIARYVAGHGPAFRERYVMASIDAGSSDDQPRPAVELEHRLMLGATAVDLKIDQVWFDRETSQYRIVDLKTGASSPPSRLQNAFYAHAWAELASPGRVLTGAIGSAIWDARAGSHDMEIVDVRAEWPLEVLEQLSGAAMAIIEAGLYLPRISGSKGFGTCGSCAHSAVCPAVMVTR